VGAPRTPAQDEKRGVGHHLCDGHRMTKEQTVLTTPFGGSPVERRNRYAGSGTAR
jgi:hypothetical protein